MLGCRVLLFVRVGLDGLVLGGILDFGSINRLVIVCRVALLIGNRKGLGNRGALFFKRYRGIELRGIKRHGAIDVLLSLERRRRFNNIRGRRLLGLKGRCSFGGFDGRGLHSLVLLELLRRELTCRLGCLLLSDSLLLGSLACGSALLLEIVDKFLALCKRTLKEVGSAGANRRERGCNVGMRRCRGNLGREISIALVRHAPRLFNVIVVRLVRNVLRRRGGSQNVQSCRGIDRGHRLGLGNGRGNRGRLIIRSDNGRRRSHDGGRLGLKRWLLALLVIERAGLGKHSERTDGIRTKADVAGGVAIELGLGLGRLLRRLGSGNLVIELFGLGSLILILRHDSADQRLVGRRTLKALDLLVESLTLFGLGLSVGSNRLTEFVLGVGRLFILDGVAVVVLLLGRGIFRRCARHFLGTTLLLPKIGIERNIVGKLVFALEGSNVVHNAEHSGDRRLVAHRARRIGKNVAVRDDVYRVGECNEGSEDRDNPQQNLERAGERQDTQDGNGSGGNRGNGQQLGDERTIRSIGLAGEQLSTGRVVVCDNDHRAVARRRERARGLVVGDDILAHARLAQARNHGVARALEHVKNGADNGQQGADQADTAADAHQQGAGKRKNTGNGKCQPTGRRGIELLNLGIKAVVAEDLSDILGSQALFFAACRRNAGVLQQVVNIVLGVRHVRSTSIIRQIGPMHAH